MSVRHIAMGLAGLMAVLALVAFAAVDSRGMHPAGKDIVAGILDNVSRPL
ncbi:MAG: hypothetical protein ACE363_06425 [Alphaproteobacteria bacterium]